MKNIFIGWLFIIICMGVFLLYLSSFSPKTVDQLPQTGEITVTDNINIQPTFIFSPESVVCGPIDVNNDNQLNYIDLYFFVKINLKTCSDIPPPGRCQGKDVLMDGKYDGIINYIDLSSFISRYSGRVPDCTPY